MQVFKDTWRIPEGKEVAIDLGFDRTGFGSITKAYGGMLKWPGGQMGMVSFKIVDEATLAGFIDAFREADKMWLTFPNGSEQPWVADMEGSRDVANAFLRCIKNTPLPSQPYGNPPVSGTQPFNDPVRAPEQPRPQTPSPPIVPGRSALKI